MHVMAISCLKSLKLHVSGERSAKQPSSVYDPCRRHGNKETALLLYCSVEPVRPIIQE